LARIDLTMAGAYGLSDDETERVRASVRTEDMVGGTDQGAATQLADEDSGETEADDSRPEENGSSDADAPALAAGLVSWFVGVAFGRFDVRLATGELTPPTAADPFAALPVCSPGMLVGPDGMPARENAIASVEWCNARLDGNRLP